MEKKQLEVGDVVYCVQGKGIAWRRPVARVSAKYAWVVIRQDADGQLEKRFKRDCDGLWLNPSPGDDRWSSTTYYLQTDELSSQFDRHVKLSKIANIDWKSLSDAQLIQVLAIADVK